MLPVSKLLRIAKIVCVGAIGLMALLIVIGNITDYYTNYQFVVHVLKWIQFFPAARYNTGILITPYWLMRHIFLLLRSRR